MPTQLTFVGFTLLTFVGSRFCILSQDSAAFIHRVGVASDGWPVPAVATGTETVEIFGDGPLPTPADLEEIFSMATQPTFVGFTIVFSSVMEVLHSFRRQLGVHSKGWSC